MKLLSAPTVQRKLMWMTPTPVLEMLARAHPRFAISLFCHWLNEKNINIEERFLSPRLIAPVPVAKKFSQLSELAILNILRQDERLWQFYVPTPAGGTIINLGVLPFILMEITFELGGKEARQKIATVITKCRTTLGGGKQAQILKVFKTDTVLDLFEIMPDGEINMIFKNMSCGIELIAFWLNHWDMRMLRINQPAKSEIWLGKIPGERAFEIEKALRALEFRKKYEAQEHIYDYKNEWKEFVK